MKLTVQSKVVRVPADSGQGYYYEGYDKIVYGYVNEQGEWAIQPIFDTASEFSEGLAYVEESGNRDTACYIDENGNRVIQFSYKEIEMGGPFNHNMAFVKSARTKKWAIIDKTGKYVTDFEFASVSDAQINSLKTLCNMISQYGASALHHASPELLVTNESMKFVKKAVRNHILLQNPKELGNKEIVDLVHTQVETMTRIRHNKLLNICAEISGGTATKIDKMLGL